MSGVLAESQNAVGRSARDHPRLVKLGRVGWFAKGVVYLVAGVLALLVAVRASGAARGVELPNKEASPTGALTAIAQLSGGAALMWALAAGLVVYAVWRVVSACLPGGRDATARITRIGYLVSAVIYLTFAATAIALARGGHANPNGNAKVTSFSDRLMAHAGGRVVVGVAGAVVVAAGIYRLVRGARGDVIDELDLSSLSSRRRTWTQHLGALGEVGRGLGIGLIGVFLLRAAVTYDLSQATGLDGALRRLATEVWGRMLVVVIGVGFVAYGTFCLATFTHRELRAP